jgi:hypothetical protein
VWKEIAAMARRSRRTLTIDFRPAVEAVGLAELIRQVGEEELVREIGRKKILRQIGAKNIVEELGLEAILAQLSPAKRRELKRLLEETETQS